MKGRSWIENNLEVTNFGKDFCGACAWASTYILHRLQLDGISSMVAISQLTGGQHAFVLTRNYIVDITATQFSKYVDNYLPEVIVMNRNKPKEYFWENIIARLRTPQEVVDYTLRPRWPEEQIPNLKHIEKTYENF